MPRDLPAFETKLKPIDRLIQALRGPEPRWWDFGCGEHCAIEVGARLGLGHRHLAHTLGMSQDDFRTIFDVPLNSKHPDLVRARHVADALEYYKHNGIARNPERFVCRGRVLVS